MFSFALTQEQEFIRETAARFAQRQLRPNAHGAEQAGVAAAVRGAFDEVGLWRLDLDEESRLLDAALAQEELAWGDAGAALSLWRPHLCAHAVRELGDRDQRERLLGLLGEAPGAVAFSEPALAQGGGSFATQATPCEGGYRLSGQKCYVLGADPAALTVVFASLQGDGQPAAFVVTGAEVRPQRLLSLSAAAVGELVLTDHFVPAADRLSGGDGLGLQRFFGRAQIVAAAHLCGLSRAAYEYALSYTQERRAFGKPVAHFQAVAFSLAEMLMEVEAARWMLWRAASEADRGPLDLRLCAQAQVQAAECAFAQADRCVQLLGGAGFIQDFPAEKWLREAKALALFGGTAEHCQEIIAAVELGQGVPFIVPGLQPILT